MKTVTEGIYEVIDQVELDIKHMIDGTTHFEEMTVDGNATVNGLIIPSHANDQDVVTLDKNVNFIDYKNLQNTFYTRVGGSSDELNPQMAVDNSGNIYMAGVYDSDELDIYDFTNNTTPVGSLFKSGYQSLFLTKYNDAGVNQWKTKIGGYDAKTEPSIYSSGLGDTFVAMQSYGDGDIRIYDVNNVSSPVKTLDSEQYNVSNTVLVKYNTDGVFQWNCRVKIVDASGIDSFSSNTVVTSDASGNLYIVGYCPTRSFEVYDTTSDSTPVKTVLLYIQENDNDFDETFTAYFIVKFDADGKYLWFNRIEGNLEGSLDPSGFMPPPDILKYIKISINTDASNNFYLTSTFVPGNNDYPDFRIYDQGSESIVQEIDISDVFNRVIFNIKYDKDGKYIWHNMIMGTTDSYGLVQTSNCLDACGNLYLTFSNIILYGYIVLDTNVEIEQPSFVFYNNEYSDLFVSLLKFDTDGKFVWNNYINTNDTTTDEFIVNPVITCNNRYVNGQYRPNLYLQVNAYVDNYLGGFNFRHANSIDISNNTIDNVAYTLQNKEYYMEDYTIHSILSKYDTDGNFEWACTSGAYVNDELDLLSTSIVADNDGHVYVGGAYYNQLYIWDTETNGVNDGSKGSLQNTGGFDIYLIKYNRFGLLNSSTHRNIYLEDSTDIPDGVEKSIVITNNNNSGPVDCLILKPLDAGFGYQVRKNISLVDSLDLVCNNGIWIPKIQADQITISNDIDVIDVNTKLSIIDYEDISSTSWYATVDGSDGSGNITNERNVRMGTDKDGNLIVIGTFDGINSQINYLYGNDYLTVNESDTSGNKDIFIAKYFPNGIVNWGTHIGFDTDIGDNTPNVYTDANGNSYISIVKTNDFTANTVYIYDTRDNSTVHKEVELYNSSTLVVKYDKDGIYQWNIRIQAGDYNTYGTSDSIAVADKDGNLYVTGYQVDISGLVILDSGNQETNIQNGLGGSFLCKFDKSGKYVWSIGNEYGTIEGYKASISCDLSGNVIMTGVYQDTIDIYQIIDGSNNLYESLDILSGNYGLYMIKYDSTGKVIWTNGLYMDTSGPNDQVTNPVTTIDGNGNFFLAAEVTGEYAYIYDTRDSQNARETVELPDPGVTNTILIKYSPVGIIQWYTFVSGISGQPSISVDNRYVKGINNNSVFISGSYGNNTLKVYYSVTEGTPNSYEVLTDVSGNNVFIAKYDTNGNFDWISKAGGSDNPINSCILADKDGHVYLAGEFNTTSIDVYQGWSLYNDPNIYVAISVDNSDTTNNTYDIFLVKYNRYGIVNNGSGNYMFGRELFLENSSDIPNGTEKTIVITNNVQNNNNNTPANVCLMIIEKDQSHGYLAYRTLWFCEGVTMICYNGKWIMKSSSTGDALPKRSIIMWGGNQNNIPAGWGLCDGTTYHGVETPDLRGRFVLGYNPNSAVAVDSTGSRAPVNTINSAGGELNHQLAIGEIPAHTHGITDPTHSHSINDPTHTHTATTYDAGSSLSPFGSSVSTAGGNSVSVNSASTGITINAASTGISNHYTGGKDSAVNGTTNISPATYPTTGGTVPHNNMPPYFVLAFIMKCY